MMSQNYTTNGGRMQKSSLKSRYRPHRPFNYHQCSCNRSSLCSVMSYTTTEEYVSHNRVINKNEDAADSPEVCQKLANSIILRKSSDSTKMVTISPEDHKTYPDLNVLHFNLSYLSIIASYYLRIPIENLVWLMSWLRFKPNSLLMRLQRCTKNIHWMRCILIFFVVTTSLAHEIHHQHLQSNEKSTHGLRTNFSSAAIPKRLPQEFTTLNSENLEHDTYSTSLTIPASPNGVSSARIDNLLRRDHILLRQQQPKALNHRNQPETPSSNSSSRFTSTCATCHARAKAKIDSLESIKLHILSRLKLPPLDKERVKHRDVPQNILDSYYSKYDHNGQKRDSKNRAHQNSQIGSQKHSTGELQLEKHDYDEQMQSDDPGSYSIEGYDDFEDEDQLHSHINSIYVFPSANKLRHNRRNEFLTFKFEGNEQTTVTGAVLHLYIRGQEWINNFFPETFEEILANGSEPEIILNVHRTLRRNNSVNYTHTIQLKQIRHKIPAGLGEWIQEDLKDFQKLWADREQDNNLIIVVKPKEDWMRHFVETGKGDSKSAASSLAAHVEIRTQLSLGRQKRSTSLDCQESDNELRCCRYPLKVNFTSFGWSFVVAPTDFDAYFCNGECKLGFLPEHPHTHLAALTRSASPCCSPTKMSSLTLLYFNFEQNLVLSTIPNMTVEKCSCS